MPDLQAATSKGGNLTASPCIVSLRHHYTQDASCTWPEAHTGILNPTRQLQRGTLEQFCMQRGDSGAPDLQVLSCSFLIFFLILGVLRLDYNVSLVLSCGNTFKGSFSFTYTDRSNNNNECSQLLSTISPCLCMSTSPFKCLSSE